MAATAQPEQAQPGAAADALPDHHPQQQHAQEQQQQPGANGNAPAAEFVNTGLETWLARRREWTRKPADYKRAARKRSYSPAVTAAQVLSFAPLPKPVPLHDVIEVLQDVWEDEDFF